MPVLVGQIRRLLREGVHAALDVAFRCHGKDAGVHDAKSLFTVGLEPIVTPP